MALSSRLIQLLAVAVGDHQAAELAGLLESELTASNYVKTDADSALADGVDLTLGDSAGTKIGTSATQKVGFFNADPVVQQSAPASLVLSGITGSDTVDAASVSSNLGALSSAVNQLRDDLVALGLMA